MKTLIASPIDGSQEELVKKWIKNISKFEPIADVLIIDFFKNDSYLEMIKAYCQKCGLKNFKVQHSPVPEHQPLDEKMGRNRELIRKEVLLGNYDLWLNWEYKYQLSNDALEKLKLAMVSGGYDIVSHVPSLKHVRLLPAQLFGVDLIRKKVLERYGFSLDYPDMPDHWHANGLWVKQRLVRDGGKCLELNINNPNHIQFYQGNNNLKLNLGCGHKHLPGYINIDIQEPCDLKHDLTTPLPFADSVVDEIYTEGNVISLFSRDEWERLKREMARVLKPGGKLEIIFIDFEYALKAFLNNKNGKRWSWWIKTIFSGQHNKYEFSKNGFTYGKLLADLSEAGFEKFVKNKHHEPVQAHLVGFKKLVTFTILFLMTIQRAISATFLSNVLITISDFGDSSFTVSTYKGKKKKSNKLKYTQHLTFPLAKTRL